MNLNPPPSLKEKNLLSAFRAYAEHMPLLGMHYHEHDNSVHTTQKVYEMGQSFIKIAGQNHAKIIKGTFDAISKYVTYYHVEMSDTDEFKLVYFMGRALSNLMNEKGRPDIGRVLLYGAVLHLEHCYKESTKQTADRPKLKSRLKIAIENGNVDEHFGEYGIYLIYKCGSNMISDHNKQATA